MGKELEQHVLTDLLTDTSVIPQCLDNVSEN